MPVLICLWQTIVYKLSSTKLLDVNHCHHCSCHHCPTEAGLLTQLGALERTSLLIVLYLSTLKYLFLMSASQLCEIMAKAMRIPCGSYVVSSFNADKGTLCRWGQALQGLQNWNLTQFLCQNDLHWLVTGFVKTNLPVRIVSTHKYCLMMVHWDANDLAVYRLKCFTFSGERRYCDGQHFTRSVQVYVADLGDGREEERCFSQTCLFMHYVVYEAIYWCSSVWNWSRYQLQSLSLKLLMSPTLKGVNTVPDGKFNVAFRHTQSFIVVLQSPTYVGAPPPFDLFNTVPDGNFIVAFRHTQSSIVVLQSPT